MGEFLADPGRIDPVKYAWTRCNPGIPFPSVIARSVVIDPSTARVGGEATAAKVMAAKVYQSIRAAVHAGIVRRRMPRPRNVRP